MVFMATEVSRSLARGEATSVGGDDARNPVLDGNRAFHYGEYIFLALVGEGVFLIQPPRLLVEHVQ